jgi:hypothetical protein
MRRSVAVPSPSRKRPVDSERARGYNTEEAVSKSTGGGEMTPVQLRKQIANQIKALSGDRLRVACHFIEYLNEHEDNAATRELLRIKGFRASLCRAEKQLAKGQTVRFESTKHSGA